jgi:hypothetical protein
MMHACARFIHIYKEEQGRDCCYLRDEARYRQVVSLKARTNPRGDGRGLRWVAGAAAAEQSRGPRGSKATPSPSPSRRRSAATRNPPHCSLTAAHTPLPSLSLSLSNLIKPYPAVPTAKLILLPPPPSPASNLSASYSTKWRSARRSNAG